MSIRRISLSPPARNEASSEINCPVALFSFNSISFLGQWSAGSCTILCHLSSSYLRKGRALRGELFICFSHSWVPSCQEPAAGTDIHVSSTSLPPSFHLRISLPFLSLTILWPLPFFPFCSLYFPIDDQLSIKAALYQPRIFFFSLFLSCGYWHRFNIFLNGSSRILRCPRMYVRIP